VVRQRLRDARIRFSAIFSHGQYLDILPVRASKGKAVRYLAIKWEIPVSRVLVGNHSPELARLKGLPRIYFSRAHYAAGILEGISHYGFLDPHGQSADKG